MKFKLDKRSKRAIWLLSGTGFYLVLGALIFNHFEYDYELRLRAEISETKHLMQLKYNFTKDDFFKLEQVVVRSIPFAAGFQWKFVGAFYFCTVVITTVGYGHSTPYTFLGKVFCIIFALIGIPLGLVMFQSVGERINYIIRSCLIKLGRFLTKRNINFLRKVKSWHLLIVSFTIGTLTIIAGTIVFHLRERWSLFDAYYYCVITLSTIGFGDFVPLQTRNHLQRDIGYVIFTLFFILFGLAIFSACVNLLILEFMTHNADIVTARTRLRRLLSLRSTPSFNSASIRSAFPTVKSKQRRTLAAEKQNKALVSTIKQSASFSKSKLKSQNKKSINLNGVFLNNRKTSLNQTFETENSNNFNSIYLRDVYSYYRLKPVYFTARRLSTRYIDHLVNTK